MITTRIAEPYDLSRIMTFDSFPGDRIAEIVERRMLVAEIGDMVVAYVAWQHGGCISKDYVNKLVVADGYRRRGIAQGLIGALNTVLAGRIFISTGAHNAAAVALRKGTGRAAAAAAATAAAAAGQIVGLLPMEEPELFFHRDLWPEGAVTHELLVQ